MDKRNVIDVSGYFLFEATGDSSEVHSSVLDGDSAAADEDDAQSCSGRVFGESDDDNDEHKRVSSCLSFEEKKYDNNISDAAEVDEEDDDDDDEEEEEVNQGWIMSVNTGDNKLMMRERRKIWPLRVTRTAKQRRRSKVCNLETMSEKERDRLFWEACLAS